MKRLYVTRMIRSLQQAANFAKDNVTVVMRIRFHEASIVVAKSNGLQTLATDFPSGDLSTR